MPWIKASEKLPTMNKTVYLKDVSADGSIILDVGELKTFQSDKPYFSGGYRMYPIFDTEYAVYWLDESEPDQEVLWDKVFEELDCSLGWDSQTGPYIPNKTQEKLRRLYTLICK